MGPGRLGALTSPRPPAAFPAALPVGPVASRRAHALERDLGGGPPGAERSFSRIPWNTRYWSAGPRAHGGGGCRGMWTKRPFSRRALCSTCRGGGKRPRGALHDRLVARAGLTPSSNYAIIIVVQSHR